MSAFAPMPCVEFVERVNEYLEGTLPEVDRLRLAAHLEVCPHCVEYLDQLRLVRERAGRVSETDLAPHVRADLLRVFEAWSDDR